MNTTLKFALILITIFSLTACSARRFDRGALSQDLMDGQKEITNNEIKAALNVKPQIQFPIRLGVYMDSYNEFLNHGRYPGKKHLFLGSDRDMLLSEYDKLKTSGIISDMFIIPHNIVRNKSIEAIRLAGAKMGADAVVHITGVYDIDTYHNPAGVLYLTIVGMWVVPGTKSDAMFLSSGIMYDIGNEYIYLAAEADGKGSKTGNFVDNDYRENMAINIAKNTSLKLLGGEIIKSLHSLKGE